MSTYETRAHVGPDRKLELYLPAELENTEVFVTVTPHRAVTLEERNAVLEWLGTHGVDDPTFVRPPQLPWPEREPFD